MSCFLSGVLLFLAASYFPLLAGLASTVSLLTLGIKRRYSQAAVLVLGALAALALGAGPDEAVAPSGKTVIQGFFSSPAVLRAGGYSQQFSFDSGAPGLKGESGELGVLSGSEHDIGESCELTVDVISPPERKNPGSRPRKQYAVLTDTASLGQGVALSPRVFFNRARQKLNNFLRGRFGPDEAGLLMAVTTGHREEVPYELKMQFNGAGLGHLLSISGTHFALFAVLLFGFFRRAFSLLPLRTLERVTRYVTPSGAAALMSFPFMLFYLGLSGASVPSVRAFIIMSLFLAGLLLGRRGYWLNSLLLAAVVLVLWEPEVLLSLSFQMSFGAVFFIGVVLKDTPDRSGTPLNGLNGVACEPRQGTAHFALGFFKKSLIATLSASMGVAPLVVYYFHYFSLVSPLANLVVTPLVGFLLVPFSIMGAVTYLLGLGYLGAPLLDWLARLCTGFGRSFTAVPYSSIAVREFPPAVLLVFYLGFLLWFFLRRRWLLPVAVLPAVLYAAFIFTTVKPLSVTFLDAGWADAAVVELPDGKVVVVDTGRDGDEVAGYLRLKGISRIDALVLSHAHADHSGGAGDLAREFDIIEVWDNGWLEYPKGLFKGKTIFRHLARGDVIEGNGYAFQTLHPYEGYYSEEGGEDTQTNNDSLVLRLRGETGSYIFAGDLEREATRDLLALGSERLQSTVIKQPHHGLASSGGELLLGAVPPEAVVISAERFQKKGSVPEGVDLFITGKHGAVKFSEPGSRLVTRTFASYALTETNTLEGEMANVRRLFNTW